MQATTLPCAIEELEGTRITPLHPLSPNWVHQGARISPRGGEASVFYGGLLIDEEPKVGDMFPLDDLPEPLVEQHHLGLLTTARDAMCVAPAIDCQII